MKIGKLVLLAGAALGLGGVAMAAEPTTIDRDEVRAVVAEMLADAETRSSLLQGGASAGHDGKFFIASNDGNFRLNLGGQIQFRYIINFSDEDNALTEDEFDTGFQTRRTKLDFTGHVINPNWTYRVLTNFDRANGNAFLEDAFVEYRFASGMRARWGQFKLPLLREELVSSSRQLAVERSVTNAAFTQGRSQGIMFTWDGGEEADWRLQLAFSDGLNSANTDINVQQVGAAPTFAVMGEADYAFTGRFEYKWAGDWDQLDDFTSPQGSPFAALLGLAAHYQMSPNTNRPTDVDRETFEYTADLSFEGDGWNAFLAFIGRHDELDALAGESDNDDFGGVAQIGWRFAPDTEIFARWDGIFADDDRTGLEEDTFHFATVGLNQYYAGHAAKATVDVIWALSETEDLVGLPFGFFPNTAQGLNGSTETGEVSVRLQFQLLF